MIYIPVTFSHLRGRGRGNGCMIATASFLCCILSLGHLTPIRCHCGTASLRLEKFLWLKAVEIIAAGGSVKCLVTSVPPLQEMRNLPYKDWDASDTVKVCLNLGPFLWTFSSN